MSQVNPFRHQGAFARWAWDPVVTRGVSAGSDPNALRRPPRGGDSRRGGHGGQKGARDGPTARRLAGPERGLKPQSGRRPPGRSPGASKFREVTGSAILLFGPPAAGKSSLARDLLTRYRALGDPTPLLYLATDPLREAISGRDYVPSARTVVYDGVQAMLASALASGHHVLIDGNYLDPHHRAGLVAVAQQAQARLLKVLVFCDLEVSLRRNATRLGKERVPEDYLRGVYGGLEQAVAAADLCFRSEDSLAGKEADLLTWLLGSLPPKQAAPSSSAAPWLEHGERRQLESGQAVWRAGEAATEVLLLLEGELEVVREQPGEPPVVLNIIPQGALAGDLSSLDGSPHSATVRATQPSLIACLPGHQFRALLRSEPDLLDRVLEGMAGRIRALSGKAGTASVDLLTGLGNRRLLDDTWPRLAAHAEETSSPLAIALFDVDRFKGINDTFGHSVGDTVLAQIAQILRASLPPTGVPLRFGGDEFVVLLPGTSQDQGEQLLLAFAERVRRTPLALDHGVEIKATVSVGLAAFPSPVSRTAELFERADQAAYLSKGQGRDRVTVWGPVGGSRPEAP